MNIRPNVQEYRKKYQLQILALILQIQQEEYGIPITKSDQPDLLAIDRFYQTGNGNFWTAIYEDKVVGTISLLDIGENQVALRKMFVAKEFRGSTLKTASLLLECAIKWAEEKSVQAIYLGTTPQFVAAHRFYEKNGFTRILPNELPLSFPVLHVDKRFYKLTLKTT